MNRHRKTYLFSTLGICLAAAAWEYVPSSLSRLSARRNAEPEPYVLTDLGWEPSAKPERPPARRGSYEPPTLPIVQWTLVEEGNRNPSFGTLANDRCPRWVVYDNNGGFVCEHETIQWACIEARKSAPGVLIEFVETNHTPRP